LRLILASQSVTRRALLEAAGLHFEALPAAVDEAAIKESAQAEGMPPADAATCWRMPRPRAWRASIRKRSSSARPAAGQRRRVVQQAGGPRRRAAALLCLRGVAHELGDGRGGLARRPARLAPRGGRRGAGDARLSDAFLDAYLAREAAS
jgi:septum formation protein